MHRPTGPDRDRGIAEPLSLRCGRASEFLAGRHKDVGQELERVRPGATELSPHWRSPEQLAELAGSQLPLGVITAVAAGLVCIAFIALNFLLNGEANRLISRF